MNSDFEEPIAFDLFLNGLWRESGRVDMMRFEDEAVARWLRTEDTSLLKRIVYFRYAEADNEMIAQAQAGLGDGQIVFARIRVDLLDQRLEIAIRAREIYQTLADTGEIDPESGLPISEARWVITGLLENTKPHE